MVNIHVGQTLNIGVAVWDFCGYSNYLYIQNIGFGVDNPASVSIDPSVDCLNISNIGIELKFASSSGSSECHQCNPGIIYESLGTVYTNPQGVASLSHTITNTDLSYYEQAIATGKNLEIIACIVNPQGQPVSPTLIGKCSESIIISPDPCQGVICPDACVGQDLYSQICDNGSCITGILIEPNSHSCGAVQEKHYMYFKVSELLPISFIYSGITPIFQATTQLISAYTDYYVESVDFDLSKYIMTITIAKTLGLGPNTNTRVQTMLLPAIPIAYYLAILAGALVAALVVFIQEYLGSESVDGEQVSTRVINVIPKICVGNGNTGIPDCSNPTPPMIISVEKCIGNNCETIEIADGNPISFSAPTNVGITITGKVKDNGFYTVIKKSIDKGITNETVTLEFIAKEDSTISPTATDATTGNPITGSYIVYEETLDGHLVEILRGNLDINGKISPPFKGKAGVKSCIIIIPSNVGTHKVQMECVTPLGGETLNPVISIKTCQEKKNSVSIRTVYISSIDSSRIGYTAETIQILINSTIFKTVTPTTDITYVDGLDKNTTYTIHVIKADYVMVNNDQQISFTTDCDTTLAIMVESNPPANSRDITVEVRNATTNNQIEGANVLLDSMPIKKTGPTGTVTLYAIPDGDHNLKISLEAYKDNESTITVSSTSTSFTKTLTVDQVNATVDTRIYEFTNIGDPIATKPIKFGGTLQYYNTDSSSYEALTDATISVTIKDITNNTIETLTAITKNNLTELGDFETGTWVIPEDLTGSQINVDIAFDGIGRYKPSSLSTSYAIAAKDSCIIPLPWGGCLLSKETGTGLLMLGALVVGGIVLLSSGTKSLTGKATERIVEKPIPPHYTPPEIKEKLKSNQIR